MRVRVRVRAILGTRFRLADSNARFHIRHSRLGGSCHTVEAARLDHMVRAGYHLMPLAQRHLRGILHRE